MNAIVKQEGHALAATQAPTRMAVADIISHVSAVQEVMRAVMKPDVHYGKIPGTGDKPTLLKPGAEVLCMSFRIAPSYRVEDLSTPDMIRYRVTCTGTHQTTGVVLGDGVGEASSSEEKYKWRRAVCPEEFAETPANMKRKKYGKAKGGGFYQQEQVRTEPADLANTVLKMANKRAHMAMVLNVTAASDCFAQDLEDMDEALREHLARRGEDGQAPAEAATARTARELWPADKFDAQFPRWSQAIERGLKTPDEIITLAKTKGDLTSDQEARIKGIRKAAAEDAKPKGEDGPAFTFAQLAEQINKAQGPESLDPIRDLARNLPEDQQAELADAVQRRSREIGLTS